MQRRPPAIADNLLTEFQDHLVLHDQESIVFTDASHSLFIVRRVNCSSENLTDFTFFLSMAANTFASSSMSALS